MELFWFILGLILGGAAVYFFLSAVHHKAVAALTEKLQRSQRALDKERNARMAEPVKIIREEPRQLVRLHAEVFIHEHDLYNPAIDAGRWAEDRLQRELGKNILGYANIQCQEVQLMDAVRLRASIAVLPPESPCSVQELIGRAEKPDMLAINVCAGNPGALGFVMAAIEKDPGAARHGLSRMLEAGITGAKLYMLWNDCCSRDTAEALRAMLDYPIEMITKHINYENGRGIPFTATAEEVPNGPGPDTAV